MSPYYADVSPWMLLVFCDLSTKWQNRKGKYLLICEIVFYGILILVLKRWLKLEEEFIWLCVSTHAGNQGQPSKCSRNAKSRFVSLPCWKDQAAETHTGTQALLGLAHPVKSGRGAARGRGHCCLPHSNKRLCACLYVLSPIRIQLLKTGRGWTILAIKMEFSHTGIFYHSQLQGQLSETILSSSQNLPVLPLSSQHWFSMLL